jgi:hypothetical protein
VGEVHDGRQVIVSRYSIYPAKGKEEIMENKRKS